MITVWNDLLARQFPNAKHTGCVGMDDLFGSDARRCSDFHCTGCGQPATSLTTECQCGGK
jgi:hypothetical protein